MVECLENRIGNKDSFTEKFIDALLKMGPKKDLMNVRGLDNEVKLKVGVIGGFVAGFVEGIFGNLILPTSIRTIGEEIAKETRDIFKSDSKLYDSLYNTFRFFTRGTAHYLMINSIVSDPQEHWYNVAGVGLSAAYELYRVYKIRSSS